MLTLVFLIVWNIVLGILVADLVSGLFHWWEDAYGNPTWKFLGVGKYIVTPNLIHHSDPRAFLKNSYWVRNNTTFIADIFLGLVAYVTIGIHWWVIVALLFLSQMNEIHAIAHRTDKENGKFLIFLQRLGIIQSKKHHGWHHVTPFENHYCILTEYLNPVLNKIYFWRGLEWLVLKVFGAPVIRGSEVRGGK